MRSAQEQANQGWTADRSSQSLKPTSIPEGGARRGESDRICGSSGSNCRTKSPGSVMARPNFIELPTRDIAASQVFFENVFGMKMTGFGPTYACTLTGDVDIGLQADKAEATKAPLPVIEVKSLEATLAAVTSAGATVTKPIFSFPGGRRFHFLDPSGNELSAMQVDPA
jgi:uncharacterized protein